MKKIFLLSFLLISLMLIVSCAPKVSDEELQAQLSELSPEELEAVTAKDSGAVAGMAKANPKLTALKSQYQKAAKSSPVCSDSDADRSYPNGLNPFKKGTVKWTGGVVNGVEDQCASETLLRENYCSAVPNGLRLAKSVNCAELNAKCVAGACAPVEAVPELFDWPTSDERLDATFNSEIPYLETQLNNRIGTPMLMSVSAKSFGEKIEDIRILECCWSVILRYFWHINGSTFHDDQYDKNGVTLYDKYDDSFFKQTIINDAVARSLYLGYVKYFKEISPDTLIGTYISSSTCFDDNYIHSMEHVYPHHLVNCSKISNSIEELETNLMTSDYGFPDGRHRVPFAKKEVVDKFLVSISEFMVKDHEGSSFVFMDNGFYMPPEDQWLNGNKKEDCRDSSTKDSKECTSYRNGIENAATAGKNIYQDDILKFYGLLNKVINKAGKKTLLNLQVTPGYILAHPKEIEKNGKALEDAIGKNGFHFELPFHPLAKRDGKTIQQEIELYKHYASKGTAVLLSADYIRIEFSTWMAAMAMNMKEPGQPMFVSTASSYKPNDLKYWTFWPKEYGKPISDAALNSLVEDNSNKVGQHWSYRRSFENGEITACNFGVEKDNSFGLSKLLAFLKPSDYKDYKIIHSPEYGTFDPSMMTYVNKVPKGTKYWTHDYFTFGAQCNADNKFCKKLVTCSVRLVADAGWMPN